MGHTEGNLGNMHGESWSYDQLSQRDKRSLIFHVLYVAESFDYQTTVGEILESMHTGFDLHIPLESEVAVTAQAIIQERAQLDEHYKPFLSNWRFDRISICTKLILRYALWELTHTDIPSTIVINEAVELAKCFAEKDAYKFVNGILDEVVKQRVAVQ